MNDRPDLPELSLELLDAAAELMGRSGRCGTVRVRGVSMLPTLRPNQIVVVEFDGTHGRFGEILLFRQADYLVVHRVVGRMRRRRGSVYARTRGDGLSHLDPPVRPASVVGRVVALAEGDRWRSFDGRGARFYARALAMHGLFWAALAVVARWIGAPVHRRVRRIDRWLLGCVHGLVFERLHPPVDEIPPYDG